MTLSLAGRCPRTGMLGAAVASSSIAVGGRCLFARAGTGAVLTQNRTDPRLGSLGLDLLAQGKVAREALDAVVMAAIPHNGWRQLAVIDHNGQSAHFSGGEIVSTHAAVSGRDVVAAGNLLADAAVPQRMVEAFVADLRPHLAERLLRGLEAGLAAGGETRPVRAAGVLVVHRQAFALVDLRIDEDDAPIAALRRLWQSFEPQLEDFLVRAIAPGRAGPAPTQ